MSTGTPTPVQPTPVTRQQEPGVELIYGHSMFFYWWPVWAVGFIMALLTAMGGHPVAVNPHDPSHTYLFHPDKSLGVIYTFVFFLVILMTNFELRGLASAIAILVIIVAVLLALYFQWWDTLLGWLGQLNIYMNMGFYVFFSVLILIVWVLTVFIFDHFKWWKVVPGQLSLEQLVGGGSISYDTRNLVFEKIRQDLFRHWILGLGSGDLKISFTNGQREDIWIRNVLFVDAKVRRIQELIAARQQVPAPPTV
jgi:hypothetical protein